MAPVSTPVAAQRLGFPLIVKPNGQGSTVGLTLVRTPPELDAALELAGGFDSQVMLERYIDGRELTVGILDDEPLAVGEIIPATGPIFDYAAKYQAGGAEEIFPAELDAEQTARIQDLALRVHRALKLDVYSRVDFRMDEDGGFWCLEVNTLPGLDGGEPAAARGRGRRHQLPGALRAHLPRRARAARRQAEEIARPGWRRWRRLARRAASLGPRHRGLARARNDSAIAALPRAPSAACAALPNRDPLSIDVAGIEPLPGEGLELRLAVRVRIQNPNDTPIEYSGAALDLDLNGRKLASGVSDAIGTVPRYGEAVLDDSRDDLGAQHGSPGARFRERNAQEPARCQLHGARQARGRSVRHAAVHRRRHVRASGDRASSAARSRRELRSSRAASRASAAETSDRAPRGRRPRARASSAAWLSRTCASLEAFGITTTSGCRSSHASAMRAGVAPSRAAIAFKHRMRAQPARVAAERRVRHQRHAVLAAPRQEVPLDAALLEVVEHLIRRDVGAAW